MRRSCSGFKRFFSSSVRDVQLQEVEIARYRQDGYILIENLLGDHLERWRRTVDAAISARGSRVFAEEQEDSTNIDFEFYQNVFTQRVNLWQTDKDLAALWTAAGSVLKRIVTQLEGISAVRIWHDQALVKEPFANPTSWHVDVPFWSFDSPHAVSLWIALDDATVDNGCLYFIPGSHRVILQHGNPFDEVKIGKNMPDIFNNHPAGSVLRTMPSKGVPMKAGSASLHNGLTVHGAHANMTPFRRRAMTLQMMPDGARFNGKKNVLTHDQMKRLKIGDVLNWEAQNPLLT